MSKYSSDAQLGCGLMGAIYGRSKFHIRKATVHSMPIESSDNIAEKPPVNNSSGQQSKYDTVSLGSSLAKPSPKVERKDARKHDSAPPIPLVSLRRDEGRRASNAARSSISSSSSSCQTNLSQPNEAKPRRGWKIDSTEFIPIATPQHNKSNDGKSMFRATSSNVLPTGQLGNLSQQGNGSACKIQRNLQEVKSTTRSSKDRSLFGASGLMGNIIRQPSEMTRRSEGLVNTTNPDVLKNLGNEKYKQGKFEEALALYDRSIALDSTEATYRSNRSAALIRLGRLVDAVVECKEAIRLDPSYERARHRLATLYVRLGEAEKALYQYKLAGPIADPKDIAQAQALQKHLSGCTQARKLKEWKTLLKETANAISSGADSAPQVYAMQAEALLRLNRHQDAYTAYQMGSNFCMNSFTELFGVAAGAYFLMTGAEVYMAAGRFEDAIAAAQQAAQLDPSNREICSMVKNVKAVASARLSGNLLFRASKFAEACVAYSQGLEHEPHNSVLLCNRAACRSKLGQLEKAVEDCTAALCLQPNYVKARLRRADCNAKLQRWEACIEDYELLIGESPADEEVGQALIEARIRLKKQRGGN